MKLGDLKFLIEKEFESLEKIDIGKYSLLKYPKLMSFLKMNVYQYKLNGFGTIMIMETKMLGLMSLTTISFTPNELVNVPYLLVDTMQMGSKRLAYVEFYNTTSKSYPLLYSLKDKYKEIADYSEKDAWYVKERMEGSLIKCGTKKEEEKLVEMIIDAIRLYHIEINNSDVDRNNLERLKNFRNRLLNEGNPSSGTLNKVLGKDNARDFFNSIIMPL